MRTQLTTTSDANKDFSKNGSFYQPKTKSAVPVDKNASKANLASSSATASNLRTSSSNLFSIKS